MEYGWGEAEFLFSCERPLSLQWSTHDCMPITKCFSNLVTFLYKDPIETNTLLNHASYPIIVWQSGKQAETS